MKYYAHSLEGKSEQDWQPLDEHLKKVAGRATNFASVFGASKWAYLAGLLHDVGKYSDDFQVKRLRASNMATKGSVDHSSPGAIFIYNLLADKGKMIAYTIAGHHGGLPNGKDNSSSNLAARLKKTLPDFSSFIGALSPLPEPDEFPFQPDRNRLGFQISFFIRMLYSCLVDADFIDTEQFLDHARASLRGGYPYLAEMQVRLNGHLHTLQEKAIKTVVNNFRAAILTQCLEAANNKTGFFSLTVPTGGGKTLSSLAFAMRHTLKNNLRRIIYVLPYTSIIEQNASVFRDIFGNDAVLEHHSNFEPEKEDRRSRLSAENWDAPLIVTTSVQFYESLFSNRPSRCRRIHNIAGSVVILDEAQTIPVSFLEPCLESLRELVSVYRTTVVLCTATQPAVNRNESFPAGLENVTEIIDDPPGLYLSLKRIKVKDLGCLDDTEIVSRLSTHPQVLCIVNTRKTARRIFTTLRNSHPDENDTHRCYHLSALMCPKHRSQVIRQIKQQLAEGKACRVVSTQLIEAGVDIDFPFVYRAPAGIDSLAQAAGRCNREGRLEDKGQLFIFSHPEPPPPGYFRRRADIAAEVMRHHDDPLSLESVEEFFKFLYWRQRDHLDENGILEDLNAGTRKGDFPFKDIAERFKLIKDSMVSIIIPFDNEANNLIQSIRFAEDNFGSSRRAQQYTVQVPPWEANYLEESGAIEIINNQFRVLSNMSLYHNDVGLCSEGPVIYEAESLIA